MKFNLVFFFLLCFSIAGRCQLKGKVTSIADGDTFTMLIAGNQQVKIRLYGIDCPEKDQDFGQVAKKYLSSLIFSDTVEVQDKGIDKYSRTLGIVFVHGTNVNEVMLKEGMAWHYSYYDHNKEWAAYEMAAREQHKGLWAKADAIAPWDWRHNRQR